jgi:hypothetical protein
MQHFDRMCIPVTGQILHINIMFSPGTICTASASPMLTEVLCHVGKAVAFPDECNELQCTATTKTSSHAQALCGVLLDGRLVT